MSSSFCTGRKLSPKPIFSCFHALSRICLTASGVSVLIWNSRAMLPSYRLGSFTAARAFLKESRFPVSFAPPVIAHCPKRVLKAATCL